MTQAEIATTTLTATDSEAGALATNDSSYPAQLHKVVQVYHTSAADGSQTQGGCTVLIGAN
jgi:hypothetical protein